MPKTDLVVNPFMVLPEISSGDPATVDDQNARMPVGQAVYITDNLGQATKKLRYVKINSTVAPVEVVGPVYWKDRTKTVVTCVMSEAVAGINSIAGVLLNKDITNGYHGFIQVAGPITMPVVAATAAGDALVGAAAQATARVAANTAPTNKVLGFAMGAIDTPVAGSAYVELCAESV